MAELEKPEIDRFFPVIFIAGGTGVGTSTLAKGIAPIVRALGILGTDSIRESLRVLDRADHLKHKWRTHLHCSSFQVWEQLTEEDVQDPVIEGYHRQSELVMTAVLGAAKRAIKENHILIIEGVHVRLDLVEDPSRWGWTEEQWKVVRRRIFKVIVRLENESVHFERLMGRDPKFFDKPQREKYREYFPQIRHIAQHIDRLGHPHAVIDSEHPGQLEVDFTGFRFYQWMQSLGRDRNAVQFSGWIDS